MLLLASGPGELEALKRVMGRYLIPRMKVYSSSSLQILSELRSQLRFDTNVPSEVFGVNPPVTLMKKLSDIRGTWGYVPVIGSF